MDGFKKAITFSVLAYMWQHVPLPAVYASLEWSDSY